MKTSLNTHYKVDAPELFLDWQDKQLGECHKIGIVGGRFMPDPPPEFFEEGLLLIPDPDNPFDGNAIRVVYRGVQVGWVPKDSTYLFRENFRSDVGGIKVISGPTHHLYVVVYTDA